jgi:hypothetical protein
MAMRGKVNEKEKEKAKVRPTPEESSVGTVAAPDARLNDTDIAEAEDGETKSAEDLATAV